jgi:5-methylcytosine-specific restriction endonuclease McrA
MARADNDLTAAEWVAIRDAWGCCAYCGDATRPLQKDCVLPLSRGGRYTLTNVVPACGSCNASKSNDEVTSWLRRKKLDERAFLLRFGEVALLLAPPPL